MTQKEIERTEIEAPYELPEGWKWCRLGDVAILKGGKRIPAGKKCISEKTPHVYIRVTDMQNDTVNLDNLMYITDDIYSAIKNYTISKEDLYLTIAGTIGRVGIIPDCLDGMNLTENALKITDIKCDKKYLLYVLKSDFTQNYFFNSYHQVAMPKLSILNASNTQIPLPPTLAEQQCIVNRIEAMFAKLDQAQEKAQDVLDSFENRKAAILHKAFTGELTANWRKENGVSDDSWEEKLFDSCIAKMQNGLSKRSGNEGTETVVLRLANIGENDFDVSDLRIIKLTSKEQENYSLTKDDVVMIRVNGSKTNVGRQLLVRNNEGWSFCDHIIRIRFETFCLPSYMVYFSNTKEYKDYIQDNMVSSAGQNTISRKGLSNLSLRIPTLDEQQEIVRILDSVLEKESSAKEAAQTVLDQIALLKKSILARAFRGEL